ncbi:DUF2867 domain-containing protein [Labrys monachus]|uniref:DUF2867 domain-containing protein n=1 Tax=Labrys monachus TaxID=217067 RepID=A0ABU0F842_9HYPH|nr:DUF2867 domain-containing protein [Labrys monachus]MDQ0390711.1 hypothetical protein [Labrys monachus]
MMRSPIVTRLAPPEQSRMAGWYEDADLLDSFVAALPAGSNADIRTIAHAVLGQPALWFKALLSIRDGIVRCFGLRTTGDLRRSSEGGDRIDFFRVLSSHDDELILGEDDRHLDFRISLMVQRPIGGPDLVFATTAVRCHNRIGRIYLTAIAPFHRLVVRSHLRRAARAGFVPLDGSHDVPGDHRPPVR